MKPDRLKHKLTLDLRRLGLPVDEVSFEIRGYSKSKYGNYYPSFITKDGVARVLIYPYIYENNEVMFPYSFLLSTAIHEMCHHLQYTNPAYVRLKGVMHDENFWILYNQYIESAKLTKKIGMILFERHT